MGSANGRHRRPRQAPAIVVAAGVTGSALAIPLLGAGAAQAADAATWDRVAECESGGTWSADFGNGSYGGLQLTPEIWKAYGGEEYAPRADLASRAQQIAVAEKILGDRGPQAWPSCAPLSGLATDGSLPGVDPGATPSGGPAEGAGAKKGAGARGGTGSAEDAQSGDEGRESPSGGHATPSRGAGKPAAKPSPTESATESGAGASSSSSGAHRSSGSRDMGDSGVSSGPSEKSEATGGSGMSGGVGGKHRGAPAAEEQEAGDGVGRESGRHASRGGEGGRGAGSPVADDTYTVRPGDNLWAIAEAEDVPGGWPALYEANKEVLGSDPDLILPGQSLEVDVKAD
ncbi:transglycosylase family protein [Streptomyces sp. NPDC052042]|uniref:transglycosylase family protein n=1 Tax=Streptomyces sp. NPDC052042 TaxID=3365683 RepID=UPI0037D67C7B